MGLIVAEYEGHRASHEICVVDKSTGDPLTDTVYWENNDCSKLICDRELTLFCYEYRGFAYYGGKRFNNLTLEFDFTLEASQKDWPCLVFASQSTRLRPIDKGNKAYMIVINHKYIEPQRFNDGIRTVFYGNLPGYSSTTGKIIENKFIRQGEKCRIKCGTQSTDGGVRLFMEVNGCCVFDYIDPKESAILDDGYFGIVVNNGFIKIEKP